MSNVRITVRALWSKVEDAYSYAVEYVARDATALANGNGYSDPEDDANVRNAVAHAHTSATLTYRYVSHAARAGGAFKEMLPGGDSDPADVYRDEFNNEIGRQIGLYAKLSNLTEAELDDLIIDALNNGEFIVTLSDPRIGNTPPIWSGPSPEWEGASDGRDYAGLPSPDEDYIKPLWNGALNALPDWLQDALDGWNDTEQIISPLVLDLDGGGVELAALNGSGSVYWDIDLDGMAEATGWITGGDGLLAIDLNEDGVINDHSELFGNQTGSPNGFAALAVYDSNSSGTITSADAQWADLLVWVDANADGYSQSGELHTLTSLGITSINLGYSNVNYDIAGNTIKQESTFVIGGNTRAIVDAWFAYDNANTVYAENYALDVRTLFLPTLRGYGELPELHISMSLNSTLREMVEEVAFSDAETLLSEAFDIESKVENILLTWAGVDAVSPSSRGVYVDARHLEFLEALLGRDWLGNGVHSNPAEWQGPAVEELFHSVLSTLTAHLLLQTDAGLSLADVTYDPFTGETETFSVDEIWYLGSGSSFQQPNDTDDLYVYREGDGNDWVDDALGADKIIFGDGIEIGDVRLWKSGYDLFLYVGSDFIQVNRQFHATPYTIEEARFTNGDVLDLTGNLTFTGTASSDTIFDTDGSNTIYGLGGVDSLSGNGGNDILIGGAGNDSLIGASGDDTYIYNVGDGSDTIDENTGIVGGSDVLQFGEGIDADDLRFVLSGGSARDMQIHVGGEIITLTGQLYDAHNATSIRQEVEIARFADTSTLDLINNITFKGTASGENIEGINNANTLQGLGGNDTLYGYGGNDSYVWSVGDGNDVIWDSAGTDKIVFGPSIDESDLRFYRNGNTLKIFVGSEVINVDHQFNASYPAYKVESILFDDTTTLSLDNLTFTGTSSGESVAGFTDNNTLRGMGGGDNLYGYAGADVLYGGSGSDYMEGGDGGDTFAWETSDLSSSTLDTIGDFSVAGGDKIDLSDVLFDAGYDPLTDLISNFVRFAEGASTTTIYVDAGGTGTFSSANDVVTLSYATDLLAGGNGTNSTETDLQTMITNGMLIAA